MRAPVLHGRRSLRYEEVPEPEPAPNEALVEVALCGICGSDLHLYDSDMAADGIVMGHEYGGTIVALGQDVRGWQVGERVVASPMAPCQNCVFCLKGEPEMCYQHYRLDMQRAGAEAAASLGAGGYGPLTRVTAGRLMRIADSLDDKQAASVEPAAVGLHAVRHSGMLVGDRVAILGGGPIGLFTLQCARAAGARRVVLTEPASGRAKLAGELGADVVLDPRGIADLATAIADDLGGPPDVVFDAAGVPATLQQAVEVVKPGGQVMMVGAAFDAAPIKPSIWVTRRVTVRAVFAYSRADYEATIAMMERGAIVCAPLVTTVAGASELPAVFEKLLGPNSEVKVMVDPRR
jgi:(R,R)-butanediol dehydrogenase/meso-butanediol dehydrogenase/diacetyl reductase